MALVYHVRPACAYKEVLGVVGHSYNLMGNNLPYGNNKVIGGIHDKAVHLYVYAVLPETFGNLFKITSGNLPQGHNILSPVVSYETVMGNVSVHVIYLAVRHGHMGAQSLQKVRSHTHVLKVVVDAVCNVTGI